MICWVLLRIFLDNLIMLRLDVFEMPLKAPKTRIGVTETRFVGVSCAIERFICCRTVWSVYWRLRHRPDLMLLEFWLAWLAGSINSCRGWRSCWLRSLP